MKNNRKKQVEKILKFFQHNFGHRPPYQILIDGTFCKSCLENRVNIKEQLPKYLGDVKLLTTQCCILEMEKLEKIDPKIYGANLILKQFAIHKCGHHNDPKSAMKCLKSMLGDKNSCRYFIASQDYELKEKARKIPGTPVLYLHWSAPTLEKPSDMSKSSANQTANDRMTKSYHSKVLEELKMKEFGKDSDLGSKRKKRKGKSEPNPLSCLKKSKKNSQVPKVGTKDGQVTKKRKRFRKRKNADSSMKSE